MLVIPIRTEADIRRTPFANQTLIAVNIAAILLFDFSPLGRSLGSFRDQYLVFASSEPTFYQFFTYQFLHSDPMHLLGNMLFLWVFGNATNSKMGNLPYLLFYLAGGVFAAWGHAIIEPGHFELVGASGSIAAVTAAYLVLFPRARVTLLVWLFIFIRFFEVPAMLLIGVKIIAWDNIIAPKLNDAGQVAHMAHLAGYLFGFVATMGMLALRALPRDQFDIFALWKRWNQRRTFASAMAKPGAGARRKFGTVARVEAIAPHATTEEDRHIDQVTNLRERIAEALGRSDLQGACSLYEQLMDLDSDQCLSERHLVAVARQFYATKRYPQAAGAFDRFVQNYPRSNQVSDVRLLLGIVYARDLKQFERADTVLTEAVESLRDEKRRTQCLDWLDTVRAALGKPTPER